MKDEETRITHEAFGQISFSRCQGRADFYGSELTQEHYITMELHESELTPRLNSDWYHAKKLVAKIRMSSGQFAEMITSMNHGSGVPCTIEYANGKRTEPLPHQESVKEKTHREFRERMKSFADNIRAKRNRAKELVAKKTLNKSEVHELSVALDWLTTEIENNIPFFAECFQEQMDKVVLEAKTEIENAITHKINTLGLQALHEQNNLLLTTKTEGE